MKLGLKRVVKNLLATVSIVASSRWPSRGTLFLMRKLNHIQLNSRELLVIIGALRQKGSCNFLIFGVGNDSAFWSYMNRYGKTIFIEDDIDWWRHTKERINNLSACLVSYKTNITQADELIASPDMLHLNLPESVESERWDVVLVDAPAGFNDVHPGRMKSIATASNLARKSGDIFVHDCHRRVEKMYCDRYLKHENFVTEVGHLRHYRAP